MSELGDVLDAFHEATACHIAVWSRDRETAALRFVAGTQRGEAPHDDWLPTDSAMRRVDTPDGTKLLLTVRGPRPAWMVFGPCGMDTKVLEGYVQFLRPIVAQFLQNTLEVEHAATELAERYEEINLLYSISEILGRTVSLEEGASTILREVSETVGAHRGSILVVDRDTNALQVIARIGGEGALHPRGHRLHSL